MVQYPQSYRIINKRILSHTIKSLIGKFIFFGYIILFCFVCISRGGGSIHSDVATEGTE